MPRWVNGYCAMKSPITGPGRSGETAKIRPYPESQATLDGHFEPVRQICLYMGDLDTNHYQSIMHDFAHNTVVPIGTGSEANHLNNTRERLMNNREWTDEQKHWIVDVDAFERSKGKHFMKRWKSRWDNERPESNRTAQNLIDNAKRFEKESWGNCVEQCAAATQVANQTGEFRKHLEWTTEMKTSLAFIDVKERSKGREYTKSVKEKWDQKYQRHKI